jgi:hypothetical protein
VYQETKQTVIEQIKIENVIELSGIYRQGVGKAERR